jgi:peptidoglycan hydrolase CwlO-like protein
VSEEVRFQEHIAQKDSRIRDLEADKQQMSQEIKLLKEKIDFLPFRIHALRLKIRALFRRQSHCKGFSNSPN